jgi:hypothetical protein
VLMKCKRKVYNWQTTTNMIAIKFSKNNVTIPKG